MRDAVPRAAAPVTRDRGIDALRAVAILGVVLGHWLVTALVVDSGTVRAASPLQYTPALTPASWVFQTLAVFFFVGGYVAARGSASTGAARALRPRRLRARLGRLFRPVGALLAVWAAVLGVLLAGGAGYVTVRALGKLALSPLWFLPVFAALTAATPVAARLHPLWPLAVVGCVDLWRLRFDGPPALGWVNVAAGWLVPYALGARGARRGLPGRRTAWALLGCGAAATAGLVRYAGYPAAMVGVPGAEVSNLNPPTLAAVTFGLAQCGAALLLLGPLRRVLRRPAAWAAVALLNLSAMTVFLWHQTAMMAVSALGLLAGGPLPGLHTVPDGGGWVPARLLWLPAFAAVLLVCRAAFQPYEHPYERSPRGT
ncbi:acyltransferase [Streptomyces sp. WMMC500]|uniref:acyltransferase family protein n=1 Tax=Streptomyces sp. WMMC500 TaxID=3015154 RepID=UPI00248A95F7|nr:acyltransferase [Streptomyces sp. WMMC500]WBB60204.1 acyltransferase [Streptomyces sp. WMMC500]